jgi:hypothetical protein
VIVTAGLSSARGPKAFGAPDERWLCILPVEAPAPQHPVVLRGPGKPTLSPFRTRSPQDAALGWFGFIWSVISISLYMD